MAVNIELPQPAEQLLRNTFGNDLSRAALEALAIEGYRTGKLSAYEVQTLLGLEDRWATETWLGNRGLHWNYGPAALEQNLAVIGTVGVLERAASLGLLDLKDAFHQIRQTDFSVSDELLRQALARHTDGK